MYPIHSSTPYLLIRINIIPLTYTYVIYGRREIGWHLVYVWNFGILVILFVFVLGKV
jgi:hypothetical protein